MQNFILEYDAPFQPTQTRWFRDDQIVQVGSSTLADISIPEDPRLSGHHFMLRGGPACCLVADMTGRGETFVNGRPIRQKVVQDGATINAGYSRFRIRISDELTRQSCESEPRQHPELVPHVQTWSHQELPSSIFQINPNDSQCLPLSELIERNIEESSIYVVVNKQAFGPNVDYTHRFLNGLPEIQSHVVCWSADDLQTVQEVVEDVEGRDAMILVITDKPYVDVLNHLKGCSSSYCMPRIIAQQLRSAPAEFAKQVCGDAKAVLIPSTNSGWEMFSPRDPMTHWQSLGLDEPEASEDSKLDMAFMTY